MKKIIKTIKQIMFRNHKKPGLMEIFLNTEYQLINIARLQHLDSLGLNLSHKKIIEYGAGIGDHTLYYLYKNSTVLPIEGREDLAKFLSQRLSLKVEIINFETELNKIDNLKEIFDIAHCYGILYHISNPAEFINSISKKSEILLLETCVNNISDLENKSNINITSEDKDQSSQAISGFGCRPDRRWIFSELKKHYQYVYMPITQPKHNQFPTSWNKIDNHNQKLVRSIFIASKKELKNSLLREQLVSEYIDW